MTEGYELTDIHGTTPFLNELWRDFLRFAKLGVLLTLLRSVEELAQNGTGRETVLDWF